MTSTLRRRGQVPGSLQDEEGSKRLSFTPRGCKRAGQEQKRIRFRTRVGCPDCHPGERTWGLRRGDKPREAPRAGWRPELHVLVRSIATNYAGLSPGRNFSQATVPAAMAMLAAAPDGAARRRHSMDSMHAFNRSKAAEWSCETRDSSTFRRSAICFMVNSC